MAKIDKILGSISPLYGMASGEGLFSNMRKISPFMHAIGESDTAADKRRRMKEEEEEKKKQASSAKQAPSLKHGGAVKKMANGGMPSIEESLKSGNRVSEQVGKETKRMMPPKKRTMPSPGESVKSGNRIARQEGAEMRKMRMAKGGVTRADGCAVRGKTKGKMV